MARSTSAEQHILAKIFVTALLGAAAYGASLLVDDAKTRVVFSFAVTAFVGGVTLVIQFLIAVENRLDRIEAANHEIETSGRNQTQTITSRLDSVERNDQERAAMVAAHIDDGLNRISEATELYRRMETSPLSTEMVTQFVRNSARLEPDPVLLFEFAQLEIARLSDMLKALSDGADVPYEGEDHDWLLGLTRVTRRTIDATSLATVDAGGGGFFDGGLWSSELGQRYLDVQGEAIRRSVRIRRVFVMDRPELARDPDFVNVCRLHHDLGIEVKVLNPKQLSAARRDALFDFIIFDGVLSYQSTPAARVSDRDRPVIVNTQLVTRPAIITDRVARFTDLWHAAVSIPATQ